MAENPSARIGLSSMLSNIYDPLGLGALFLLKGRSIIQQLCRDTLSWNEPMENINIPRCYKSTGFSQIVEYALHHFSNVTEK